jgi:hypothetical protein
MRKNYFGEILNEAIRQFCIDGTVVMKTLKDYDPLTGRQKIVVTMPDITNIYIDPTEPSIQQAGAVIERNVLKASEVKEKEDVWRNVDKVRQYKDLARVYRLGSIINPYGAQTEVPFVEIYERWGDLPASCYNEEDLPKEYQGLSWEEKEKTWLPSVAIVSNLTRSPIVHAVKYNKGGKKPYEEARFRKIFGRWHGRGVGELLLGLQSYINETINLRLNKARISQIGLFKVRKGSGINQNILNSLMAGGMIPVTRMDDIQELSISDIKASSYEDERAIYQWAQRASGAFETGRGELLPSSMPATTAVLQNQGQAVGFDLLQENLGLFLSRLFERHIIPIILETVKQDEVVSIIGDPDELKEIDESYINSEINKAIINYWSEKKSLPPSDYVEGLRKFHNQALEQFGKTRYLKVNKKLLTNWEYEVQVFVTGESFNKAVMIQQMNALLQTYSQIPGVNIDTEAVFKELLDLMGLGGARFIKKPQEQRPVLPERTTTTSRATPTIMPQTEVTAQALTPEATGNRTGTI